MPRILIVDDNSQNADLLEAHLDGSGLETRVVSSGEAALAAVKDWPPDVILLDVMMPKMSGFDVCRQLRAAASTSTVSVLMVTALDEAVDIEKAVNAGTDDFITKPINKTELLLRVRAMLESRKHNAEVDRTLAYLGRVQQGV
jgi:DNA-binding response OmpR family regulator